MFRSVPFALCLASVAAIVCPGALAQPPAPDTSGQPHLLSDLPLPKIGAQVQLGRDEVVVEKDDDGLLEVMNVAAGPGKTVTIPSTDWGLDADGWFDSEGFNLTKAYPRSGFWAMRTTKGNQRPPISGLPSATKSLVPQTPPRLYRAGPGDIITHIDGIPVTSFDRYVYAVNNAPNHRDIPVVVMSGSNGRKHVYYITAYKSTE
jgi:hypothetical protein